MAVDYAGWVCENELIVLKCNYIIQVQYRELKLQVNLLLVTTINGIEMIYIIMVTMLIYWLHNYICGKKPEAIIEVWNVENYFLPFFFHVYNPLISSKLKPESNVVTLYNG